MGRTEASLPSGRLLAAVDVAAAGWVLVWVVLGFVVAGATRELTGLSGTVEQVGADVERAGSALELGAGVPVLGEAFAEALRLPAEAIQEAGATAREGGAESTARIEALSLLLGLAVALIPVAPLLAGYLPARVDRAREASAVRAAAEGAGEDPRFQELLARRAAGHLSMRALTAISPEPWSDLAEGRFDRLAEAELDRLGVR